MKNIGTPLEAIAFAVFEIEKGFIHEAASFIEEWNDGSIDLDEYPDYHPKGKEPGHVADDGSVRKDHYGPGRQPWDDIVDAGWGPAFAAGNALKYVRRAAAKNGEDDLAKGRWYYNEMIKRIAGEVNGPWTMAFDVLEELLARDERKLLRAPPELTTEEGTKS